MKLLAFCLLLGMSAQGQTPEIDTNVFVNTFIGCAEGVTINIATRSGKNDVIAKCHDGYYERVDAEFAKAAQRAADETGPLGDGPNPPWPPAEPVDVPAVHHEVKETSRAPECLDEPYDNYWRMWRKNGDRKDNVNREGWPNLPLCDGKFPSGTKITFTCVDKARVLLTSEDGKKHCIKF